VQFEELHLAFAQIEVDQALIASDAMLLMHDRRTHLQFGEIPQPVVDRSPALRHVASAPRRTVGVQFGFGDDRQLIELEAVMQRATASDKRCRSPGSR
jgi:hypothetical protein